MRHKELDTTECISLYLYTYVLFELFYYIMCYFSFNKSILFFNIGHKCWAAEWDKKFKVHVNSQQLEAMPELKKLTVFPILVGDFQFPVTKKKTKSSSAVIVYLLNCIRLFCNPMDYRVPGSSVPGILQARILEWVAYFLLQGIFLIQGLNPQLLHWQVDSLPLTHQGSPSHPVFFFLALGSQLLSPIDPIT